MSFSGIPTQHTFPDSNIAQLVELMLVVWFS